MAAREQVEADAQAEHVPQPRVSPSMPPPQAAAAQEAAPDKLMQQQQEMHVDEIPVALLQQAVSVVAQPSPAAVSPLQSPMHMQQQYGSTNHEAPPQAMHSLVLPPVLGPELPELGPELQTSPMDFDSTNDVLDKLMDGFGESDFGDSDGFVCGQYWGDSKDLDRSTLGGQLDMDVEPAQSSAGAATGGELCVGGLTAEQMEQMHLVGFSTLPNVADPEKVAQLVPVDPLGDVIDTVTGGAAGVIEPEQLQTETLQEAMPTVEQLGKAAVAAKAAAQGFRSKFIGVSWSKKLGLWRVQITHNHKKHHLGYFDDDEEAGEAYDTEARRLRGSEEVEKAAKKAAKAVEKAAKAASKEAEKAAKAASKEAEKAAKKAAKAKAGTVRHYARSSGDGAAKRPRAAEPAAEEAVYWPSWPPRQKRLRNLQRNDWWGPTGSERRRQKRLRKLQRELQRRTKPFSRRSRVYWILSSIRLSSSRKTRSLVSPSSRRSRLPSRKGGNLGRTWRRHSVQNFRLGEGLADARGCRCQEHSQTDGGR